MYLLSRYLYILLTMIDLVDLDNSLDVYKVTKVGNSW